MIFVGIDPDSNGGVALIYDSNDVVLTGFPGMPKGKGRTMGTNMRIVIPEVRSAVRNALWSVGGVTHIILEEASVRPMQGIASTGFTMALYGAIYSIVLEYPYTLVSPQAWKKVIFGDRIKGLDRPSQKRLAKEEACRLYGDAQFRDLPEKSGLCEAVLMAHYGKVTHRDSAL